MKKAIAILAAATLLLNLIPTSLTVWGDIRDGVAARSNYGACGVPLAEEELEQCAAQEREGRRNFKQLVAETTAAADELAALRGRRQELEAAAAREARAIEVALERISTLKADVVAAEQTRADAGGWLSVGVAPRRGGFAEHNFRVVELNVNTGRLRAAGGEPVDPQTVRWSSETAQSLYQQLRGN